ncbi:efflux RND transporter periplasmic adaptor subunit [Oculatella sp. LEGE 06141]|nr:efflux RND transporter periplasmic adaptor subunit [Oculatella sp. LEGE 06141]
MFKWQDKSFKTGAQWLVLSGVLTVISIGSSLVYMQMRHRAAAPVTVPTLTVERGTVETTINVSGTLQLGGQQTLRSPAEGAVDQVLVEPGDRVDSGQVVVVLRNPERQTALANQQVKIEQQAVLLARRRQEIAIASQQLSDERAFLQNLATLAADGAVARTAVRDQEERVRTVEATMLTAAAEAQTVLLELEGLKLEQQRIQQQLQDSVVTAPVSGIVLGVEVKDGDGIDRRTELLTLGNPSQELVQLQLSTLDAAQVRLNHQARVSVIGPSAQVFAGRVRQIYPQAVSSSSEADRSSGRSESAGQPTVPTTVSLDQPTRTLIPGSPVNVEIVLEQRSNVIALDIEAVQQTGAEPFVWRLDEAGKAQSQPIALGLEGLTTVEVTSGLRAGDRVLLPSPDITLQPGTTVIPQADIPSVELP